MFDTIFNTVDYLGPAVFALEFIVIRFLVKLFGLGDNGLERPSGRYFERRDEACKAI